MITPQAPVATEGRTIYRRPSLLTNTTSYCPGCGHGIVHRLLAEVLEELGVGGQDACSSAPSAAPSSPTTTCALDAVESPHGRAAAVATGVKRYRPDKVVFTYQGDGDLAAIGTAEIVHAAGRGERFTTIFVNNGIYGMTGGQMAPTTLPGQKTTSSPGGRDTSTAGYPLPVTEMLSLLPGVQYAARVSVGDPGLVGKAKAAIKRAFEVQLEGNGFSIVEVLSTCPVGWGMTPTEAMDRLRTDVDGRLPGGHVRGPREGHRPALPTPAGTDPVAAAPPPLQHAAAKRALGRLED